MVNLLIIFLYCAYANYMLACLGLLYSALFLGDDGLKGFKGLKDDKVLRAGMSVRFCDFLTNMRGKYSIWWFRSFEWERIRAWLFY